MVYAHVLGAWSMHGQLLEIYPYKNVNAADVFVCPEKKFSILNLIIFSQEHLQNI